MIFISRNSSRITNIGEESSDRGFSHEVIYKKTRYHLLHDASTRGDGLVLEKTLKLKREDVLVLKGGRYDVNCGTYIKESVANKEGLKDLRLYFKGILQGSCHVLYIAGILGEVDMKYYRGEFDSKRISEPEKQKELKILVSAAKKLEQEGLSPQEILKILEDSDDVIENDILLDDRKDELKSLCGWK